MGEVTGGRLRGGDGIGGSGDLELEGDGGRGLK